PRIPELVTGRGMASARHPPRHRRAHPEHSDPRFSIRHWPANWCTGTHRSPRMETRPEQSCQMDSRLQQSHRKAKVSLTEAQVDELRAYGTVHTTRAGDVLYEAGDTDYCLVVVLSGQTMTIDRSDGEDRILTTSGPREFDGELGLLTGQNVLTTCIVR